jgi:hypothetical protein
LESFSAVVCRLNLHLKHFVFHMIEVQQSLLVLFFNFSPKLFIIVFKMFFHILTVSLSICLSFKATLLLLFHLNLWIHYTRLAADQLVHDLVGITVTSEHSPRIPNHPFKLCDLTV